MKLKITSGTTSRIIRVFIQDSSVSTGAGLTGLVHNTASLTAYYSLVGSSSATAITLVTATAGTWTSGGFIALDGTNMPGIYELHLPNACLTGGTAVHVMLKGATNMVPVLIEIELDAVDYQTDAFGAATAAQVNAEVLDVLNVDTFAELSAPPAATSSLRAKLTWLFMWARNRSTQTATERKLYADDATTIVGTEAVSDDGTTYSKGEAS